MGPAIPHLSSLRSVHRLHSRCMCVCVCVRCICVHGCVCLSCVFTSNYTNNIKLQVSSSIPSHVIREDAMRQHVGNGGITILDLIKLLPGVKAVLQVHCSAGLRSQSSCCYPYDRMKNKMKWMFSLEMLTPFVLCGYRYCEAS